ncbi:MAG: O-antigen ligase family protein [Planctomycetota bacterium]
MTQPRDLTASEPEPTTGGARLDLAENAGVALIVGSAVLLTVVTTELFPGWDVDPSKSPYTPTSLGPGGVGLLSVLQVLGAALLLGAAAWRGTLRTVFAVATIAGVVGPVLHATLFHSGDAEQVRLSLSWAGAFAGAGAIAATASPKRAWFAVAVAALVALPLVFATKGVLQLAVEHRLTVENYEQNKQAFWNARGWTAASPEALQFERRLRQPEPTAWFGLANVFASFAAASAVAFAGWAVEAITARRRTGEGLSEWKTLSLIASALGLAVMVGLAGSKGGYAVAAFGLAAVVSLWFAAKLGVARWVGAVLGVLAIALPLGAVLVRGALGTELDELSLLFRSFYLEGSIDAAREAWPIGAGPDGLQEIYPRVKPELAPEDVKSAHSVFFDQAVSLGVFALGSAALLLLLSAWPRGEQAAEAGRRWTRGHMLALLVVGGVTSLIATRVEGLGVTIESAVSRLVGVGLFVGVGSALGSGLLAGRLTLRPLVAAGLVVLAHGQIEMTLTRSQPVGLGLLLLAVGLGASAAPRLAGLTGRPLRRPAARIAGIAASVALVLGVGALAVRDVPRLSAFTSVLRAEAQRHGELAEALSEFGAKIEAGTATIDEDREVSRLAIDASLETATAAADLLDRFPTDLRLHRLRIEQTVRAVQGLIVMDRLDEAMIEAFTALAYGDEVVDAMPDSAEAWSLLVQARFAAMGLEGAGVGSGDVADAMIRAAELDPLDPVRQARLAQWHERFQEVGPARAFARRALELSEGRRLDPLAQLPDELIRILRAILADAPEPVAPTDGGADSGG